MTTIASTHRGWWIFEMADIARPVSLPIDWMRATSIARNAPARSRWSAAPNSEEHVLIAGPR